MNLFLNRLLNVVEVRFLKKCKTQPKKKHGGGGQIRPSKSQKSPGKGQNT